MDILVIGDYIQDEYIFGTAERLCPEAPVPVIVPHDFKTTNGGAGLVSDQLAILLGNAVGAQYGSLSEKKRIFVGTHLICRLDNDSKSMDGFYRDISFIDKVLYRLGYETPQILVVSDYGKGAFTKQSAKRIMNAAKKLNIRVLVDAKKNWDWWKNAFAYFPNQREAGFKVSKGSHLIHKLGAAGCSVDGIEIPLEKKHEARDTTGAGDIFIAGFAYYLLQRYATGDKPEPRPDRHCLCNCARFANWLAAQSVEHVGTYVVPKEMLDKFKETE